MTKHTYQKTFKRVETKYLVSPDQLAAFLSELDQHMVADDFASSTISSLYVDTPDFRMIQDSLAKKHGKEKIRLRTYDPQPDMDSPVFLEVKQKIDGVGYKFREETSQGQALASLAKPGDLHLADAQLAGRLQDLQDRYGQLSPQMLIRYQRRSFKGKSDPSVRVTLDSQVTYWPSQELALADQAGLPLLPDGQLILEIKTKGAHPLWLSELLEGQGLEQVSLSKYGRAYQLYQVLKGEVAYA